MKQIEKIAAGANFNAVSVGKSDELNDYVMELGSGVKIPGKVFEFQVDGQVFPVSEGSVVRVAPAGKRSVRNNGTRPLVMLCVQYKSGTFTAEDAADGIILQEPVQW